MTKQEFKELCKKKIVILDGATGTNLQKAGMPTGVCPEQWILENKEKVKALQTAFLKAGTDILYAPTFSGNRIKLAEYGLQDKLAEMNRELVQISKNVTEEYESMQETAVSGKKTHFVAGDLTMTGELLYPIGKMKFEELVEIYTLVEAGDGDGAWSEEGCEVPAFQWFVQGDGILQQIAPDGSGAVCLGGKAGCRSVGVVAEGEAAAALHGGNHQGGGQAGLAENHGLQNAQLVVCAHLVYKPGAMEEGSTEKAVCHHEYGHAVLVDMVKVLQQVLVLNLCFDHTNTILLFSQGCNHEHLQSPAPPLCPDAAPFLDFMEHSYYV